MTWLQKFATGALVSVIVLIFVGAIVRVTGAGLGCPDWPFCWGCVIPPWKVEQVDLERIDFERFRLKAERLGRDPDTVTPEHILESFNPVHTWTEFVNRLTSIPVGIFSLLTAAAAALCRKRWPWVNAAALASFVLVIVNAVLGAMVVYSGLKPGVITAHMAMAMLLLTLLVYVAWRSTGSPWLIAGGDEGRRRLRRTILLLLGLILIEGILGSQIRERTDELARSHAGTPRGEWIDELEATKVYLIHRSFSWAILVAGIWGWHVARRLGRPGRVAIAVMAVIFAQMVLGLIMAQVHIHAVAQVLHVGLSGILVTLTTLWLCGTFRTGESGETV